MAQTRRTHTKSRAGCFECKRRKVKCNEEKPTCSGCEKRSTSCHYPTSTCSPLPGDLLRPFKSETSLYATSPVREAMQPALEKVKLTTPVPSVIPLSIYEDSKRLIVQKSLGHFDKEDMALWHQFLTQTAATMSGVWVKELSHLALSCDFLMHGILSTAALHRAHLNPELRVKYDYLAVQHQDLALGPFQIAISNITSENCNEVLAFSLLLIVSQFASYRSPDFLLPSPEAVSQRGVANWIVCLRGCSTIVEQATSRIKAGPLGSLIIRDVKMDLLATGGVSLIQDEDSQSVKDLADYLKSLESIKGSTTVAEMEAYTDAINLLQTLLVASSCTDDPVSCRYFSSMWAAKVSDTFVRVLSEQRPPALAIMAHYCLLLKRCRACWYMEHRAYDLFEAVRQNLPEEWTSCVKHPLKVFKGS